MTVVPAMVLMTESGSIPGPVTESPMLTKGIMTFVGSLMTTLADPKTVVPVAGIGIPVVLNRQRGNECLPPLNLIILL